jgi:hypothetical protein
MFKFFFGYYVFIRLFSNLSRFKINNMSNLWLDVDYQLEFKILYENIVIYIHQIYSNEFLKLKKKIK